MVSNIINYSAVVDNGEPKSFKEAMRSSKAPQWSEAANKEMESILKNKTWTLTDPPPGRKVIGCKWVFKEKTQDGNVVKHKARLCAQGFSQVKGVDYNDTFSPVVRLNTIRILFGFAAQRDLDIYHYYVDSAFLQSELK